MSIDLVLHTSHSTTSSAGISCILCQTTRAILAVPSVEGRFKQTLHLKCFCNSIGHVPQDSTKQESGAIDRAHPTSLRFKMAMSHVLCPDPATHRLAVSQVLYYYVLTLKTPDKLYKTNHEYSSRTVALQLPVSYPSLCIMPMPRHAISAAIVFVIPGTCWIHISLTMSFSSDTSEQSVGARESATWYPTSISRS